MTTLELRGRITENGDLEVHLPTGLPVGEVTIHIEVPSPGVDWEQQPWSDEEIHEMMQPKRSSLKQLVEWLNTNPPTEPWGGLSGDDDAAEYVHNLRHQTSFNLPEPGENE